MPAALVLLFGFETPLLLVPRGKQSMESLEAEFDALEADGSAVEALLERPAAEVLHPGPGGR